MRPLLEAVDVRPPDTYLWFGRRDDGAGGGGGGGDPLADRLAARLEREFFGTGGPLLPGRRPATPPDDGGDFVRALSQANGGRGAWQAGGGSAPRPTDEDAISVVRPDGLALLAAGAGLPRRRASRSAAVLPAQGAARLAARRPTSRSATRPAPDGDARRAVLEHRRRGRGHARRAADLRAQRRRAGVHPRAARQPGPLRAPRQRRAHRRPRPTSRRRSSSRARCCGRSARISPTGAPALTKPLARGLARRRAAARRAALRRAALPADRRGARGRRRARAGGRRRAARRRGDTLRRRRPQPRRAVPPTRLGRCVRAFVASRRPRRRAARRTSSPWRARSARGSCARRSGTAGGAAGSASTPRPRTPASAPARRTARSAPALADGTRGDRAVSRRSCTPAAPTRRRGETALGAIGQALAHAGELPAGGLYGGRLGVAYAAARCGLLLGDERLVRTRGPAGPRPRGGAAGVPGSSTSSPARAGHDRRRCSRSRACSTTSGSSPRAQRPAGELLAAARRSARRLVVAARRVRRAQHGLCGFAHGAAGAAWALLELFARHRRRRATATAPSARWTTSARWFDPDAGDWPDLRGVERREPRGSFRSPYPSGWSARRARHRAQPPARLARSSATSATARRGGDRAAHDRGERRARAAASPTRTSASAQGLAGRADVLLLGAALLPEGAALARRAGEVGSGRHGASLDRLAVRAAGRPHARAAHRRRRDRALLPAPARPDRAVGRCCPPRTRQDERRMAPAPRNLVNLKSVAKGYGSRSVLHDITLGVNAGERIGIVGRNGDGKSTLLRLIAGIEEPDAGLVTRGRDVHLGAAAPGRRARRVRDDPRRARRHARRPRVGRRPPVSRRARRAARRRRAAPLPARDGHRDRRPVRRRTAADRDRPPPARRPRAAHARRADEPPRRRGRQLARRAPRRAPRLAARRDPRSLVSRRGLHGDVGGRRARPCTSTRAATRRTSSRAPSAIARRRRGPTAATSCCARSSPGCAAARRRARASRSSASTPRTR